MTRRLIPISTICVPKYWQFPVLTEHEGSLLYPPLVSQNTDSLLLWNQKAHYCIHHLCLKIPIPCCYGTRRPITVFTICVSKYRQYPVLTEPEVSLVYPPLVSQSTDNSLPLRNLKVINVSAICVSKYWRQQKNYSSFTKLLINPVFWT